MIMLPLLVVLKQRFPNCGLRTEGVHGGYNGGLREPPDQVDWAKLSGALRRLGLDWRERRLICDLYSIWDNQ